MHVRRVLVAAAVMCVAAAGVSGVASAGHRAAAADVTTIKAVAPLPQFQINRFVQTTLRWNKDSYTVKSGGTLHIVNLAADEGPHTFTVVAQKDEPKTIKGLFNCSICLKLAKAHGANPNTDAPPKFPFLENGVGRKTPPQVNQPGDSGVTGKGKKGESIDLRVTAPAGTKLYFICLIHPWMQSVVNVT
jgi:uncharacterized cupredoxin-like copper-binding protein